MTCPWFCSEVLCSSCLPRSYRPWLVWLCPPGFGLSLDGHIVGASPPCASVPWFRLGMLLKWGYEGILLSFSSLAVLELYFLQPMVTSQLLSVFNCRATDAGVGDAG